MNTMNVQIANRIRKYHYRFDANETLGIYFVLAAFIATAGSIAACYGDIFYFWWVFQRDRDWLGSAAIYLGENGKNIITVYGIFIAYILFYTQPGYLRYYLRKKFRNTRLNAFLGSRKFARFIPPAELRGYGNHRVKGLVAILLTLLVMTPVVIYMATNASYWVVFYMGFIYLFALMFIILVFYLIPLVLAVSFSRKSLMFIRSAMVDSLLNVHRSLKDGRDLWVVAELLIGSRDRLSSYCIRADLRGGPSWVKEKFTGHAAYLAELYGWCLVPSSTTRDNLIYEVESIIEHWALGSLDNLPTREVRDRSCHERRWVFLLVAVTPLAIILGCKWTGLLQLDAMDYTILGLLFTSVLYWAIGGSLVGLRGAIEDSIASSVKRIGAG